ncbi:MAG: SpoVT/AbrB protein [uncultured bacterium]|nr:MAG: SpoVT/AbrB protein [uncultured bacterium]
MKKAKIFTNGHSQAIRLPKEYRFDAKEVFIKKWGTGVILFPSKNPIHYLKNSLHEFSDDFLTQRNQPPLQKRDIF